MLNIIETRLLRIFILLFVFLAASVSNAEQQTPEALAANMVAGINAKNKSAVQALIHPQVASYLRVTDPAMLDNITTELMKLKIPAGYKVGVVSLDQLGDSGMASYDKSAQVLTMMGSPAYYKFPPTHLMAIVIEKEKMVEVDGKQEKKMIKVPLTPTPLPIAQYQGNWYIVIAVGKK